MSNSMNWEQLLSPRRFGESQGILDLEPGRTPFDKDYDRLIFSSAFRRLDRKTQVHPLAENDHVHSRLTHSIDALNRAQQALDNGRAQLEGMGAGELLAEDLRMAQNALNEITGEFTADDLLGKIFSSFCIGK